MNRLARLTRKAKQRGAALFIALVALVSMTLAVFALVMTVDTSNQVAGNLAFRQAALQAADIGMAHAIRYLSSDLDYEKLEQNQECTSSGSYKSCRYFALHQGDNSYGEPAFVDWDKETVRNTFDTHYEIRYIIERMCTGTVGEPIPTSAVNEQCHAYRGTPYYRITLKVNGPRNTSVTTQTIYRRPRNN